mgnify:CR=1 FL=1
MTTINLRIPKNYHQRLVEVSSQLGISINQLIINAIGEKISALDSEDSIQSRANRASREKFNEIMDKVKDVEPDKRDTL